MYFDYKSRANQEVPHNPWRIQNTALFPRLDSFLERCHDLLDLCKTVVQFQKLERIEIGGNKGRTLSASVGQIYADFASTFETFAKVARDPIFTRTHVFLFVTRSPGRALPLPPIKHRCRMMYWTWT